MAFVNDHTERFNPLTVDKERGIKLEEIPAGPEPVFPFVLSWHGQEIIFSGEMESENFQNDQGDWNFNYDWEINVIAVPENFPETEETISQVIAEALDTFGEGYSRKRVGDVKVTITQRAFKNGRGRTMQDFVLPT